MHLPDIANRTREIDLFVGLFEEIESSKISTRILLVEAPEKFGKSWLMKQFSNICNDRSTTCLPISLHAPSKNPVSFMEYVCEHMEICSGFQFSKYQSEREKIDQMEIGISVERVNLRDNNSIKIDSSYYAEMRLERLQRAFLKDLVNLNTKCVFLIDTFDQASDSLRSWISDYFLPIVSRNSNLIVVISGRVVPNSERIEWQALSQKVILSVIRDTSIWYSFLGGNAFLIPGRDSKDSKVVLEALVQLANGVPGELMKTIDILMVKAS